MQIYSPLVFSYIFQCEPGLGASVMYNLLYNKPQKLMLLAGCSTVCTTVAEAAKMWNLIVVSFVIQFFDCNRRDWISGEFLVHRCVFSSLSSYTDD